MNQICLDQIVTSTVTDIPLHQSTSTMYALQIPTSTIMFQEPTYGQKGQKMIDISFDQTSKAWSQRVIFQVCKNESEALRAPFGLSKPRDGEDTSKRSVELILENEDVITKIRGIDDHIKDYALKNSKALFRKELSASDIENKYKSILKYREPKEGREGYYYIMVKTKSAPEKPTPVKVIEKNSSREGTVDDMNYGCKVVPIIRLLFIWFMSDSFGVSPQADRLLVFPGPKRSFLDDFILTKDYVMSS
jgi:hypothetical protein